MHDRNEYESAVLRHLGQIAGSLQSAARDREVAQKLERIDARQERMDRKLDCLMVKLNAVAQMEVEQMAFSQDVLDKITRQTTLIGSIKTWIQNQDGVTPEAKAQILAALDMNSTELETALPANVVDPNA